MNRRDTIITTLLVALIVGTGYYFHDAWSAVFFPIRPCEKPVTYSIGSFDEKFNISEADFLRITKDAEKIWEDATGKQLFTYKKNGVIDLNLVYDYRQEATQKLNTIGSSIDEDKVVYDSLHETYNSLLAEYDKKKAEYDEQLKEYEAGKYDKPEEVATLNRNARELNALSSEINALVGRLNELAKKLNIKVADFNTIGASTGEEFSEGEYIRDKEGTRINVYQFESEEKLKRLLEHELGHALGLGHVENPDAIMYRLNSSTNDKLTSDDIEILNDVCNDQSHFAGTAFLSGLRYLIHKY
jgi:hypothetical protein